LIVKALSMPKWAVGLLAFAAGVVDACTYLALFGLFVAQVTGSFVIVGVQLIDADPSAVIRALAIPVFFLAGFITAFLVAIAERDRTAVIWVISSEIAMIGGFVVVGLVGAPFASVNAPLAIAASALGVGAMGVQSAMVRLLMRGISSTNVMTTNTTQAALDLAQWMVAARRARRNPHDADADVARRHARLRFAKLWPVIVGFFAGTIAGVLLFRVVGFWCPVLSLLILAALLAWILFGDARGG
jgi:uncharacterized membrane protein YoaK (UPF0700 family)